MKGVVEMRVLVSAASRHGSTTAIAEAIGGVLSSAGIETEIRPPEGVTSVATYDGVVLGSGIYAGHWLTPAKKLVEREAAALASVPVWLFSSGPIGDPPKPDEEPVDIAQLRDSTQAIDHRVFAGVLDRRQLGLAEKAIIAVVRAPEGDFRQWDAITEWASGIARTLQARVGEDARSDR
jgi:menaquinone-dependent protoporphyrinogen oxidase